ncbi:MAG: type II secretion system protein GspD [Deltaproteobacteria bacterium RBG_16_58_17]|nr:MAG: type II secretion system protein GspD [Deltaproteobacteria bacterium RBG_16_58_17]
MPFVRKNPLLRIFTFIFAFFVLIVFLSPDTGRAARLAGEEDPVPTITSQPPEPPKQPVDREEAPAKTEDAQPAVPAAVAPSLDSESAPRPAAQAYPPQQTEEAPAKTEAEDAQPAVPAAVAPSLDSESAPRPAAQSYPPQQTGEAPPPQVATAQGKQYVTIDFDNVDIQVFIKFVSELTGRNFVIDEKVRGKVTVISPRKIAVDEVYKVFESILEIYGFATVQAGEVIKVIPSQDARGQNLELRLKKEAITPEDKLVTQILSLQYAGPDEMKKVLDPLISKTSIILAYAPTGMLIITDVLSNIQRLQNIVTALDVEGVSEQISFIPLQAASATEIAKSLVAVFPPQQRPGIAPIRIVPDERTNSVILLANEINTAHVKKLISLMDRDIPRSGTIIHVYQLQNGNAEDMAKVLMNIPKDTKDAKPPAPAAAVKTAILSKDVNVLADKATNTLIITADRDDYKILEEVIQKLDVSRPMVYIESLIMEVSVNKAFNIGVEWRGLREIDNADVKRVLGPGSTALGMGGFTGQSIIPQVNPLTGAVTMPSGLSLGVIGAGIKIGDLFFPNIGAVLQAYQKDSDVSILSTPQLLTINNEEAEINVGKNVPYITRSDTSATVPGQTFGSSYEYKDVGIILKITPNINEEQFVRLKIDQQVTKLADVQTSTTPTTLKRSAKTTVVIKDNETVVIGGMIDDSTSIETAQVPCLGDIPILGWLFKTMGRGREKTNLFVFITPHIIRNQAEAAAIYQKKIDEVGNIEEGIIKMNEKRSLKKPDNGRKE